MILQVFASFLLLLCCHSNGVVGVLDTCSNVTHTCLEGPSDTTAMKDPCRISAHWLICIEGARDVCQLVETNVTFTHLATAYNETCHALLPHMSALTKCKAVRNCSSEAMNDIVNFANISDQEERIRRQGQEVVKTDFWCRFWLQQFHCMIKEGDKCSNSTDLIKSATKGRDKLKATCIRNTSSGAATQTWGIAFFIAAALIVRLI